MDSNTEVPIFTDTNLGTRIAVSVPPNICARDFKKKLEAVHSKCYPESGEIEIYGLKVKRRSFYYHLTDSVPIKHAFEGVRGMWRFYVDARTLRESANKASGIIEPLGPIHSVKSTDKTDTTHKKRKECRLKEPQSQIPSSEPRIGLVYDSSTNKRTEITSEKSSIDYKEKADSPASRSVTEVSSEMFSEVKSVASILRRYFPSSNEKETGFSSPTSSDATSKRKKKKPHYRRSSVKANFFPKYSHQSPSNEIHVATPTKPAEKAVKDGIGRADFGERIVMATNNITPLSSKKKSVIHLHRKAASLIQQPEFDISSSD